jgi:hypothetical protein
MAILSTTPTPMMLTSDPVSDRISALEARVAKLESVVIIGPSGDVVLKSTATMSCESATNFTVKCGSNISIEASAGATFKSLSSMTVQASASMTVQASGTVTLRGAMVNIN